MEKDRISEKRGTETAPVLITVEDPCESYIDKSYKGLLFPVLSFKAFFFKKKSYTKDGKTWVRKERVDYRKPIFEENDEYLYFPTGLVQKVQDFLSSKGVGTIISYNQENLIFKSVPPEIPGIELRLDQIGLIRKATARRRGVIVSPTGSGKTILQIGILSQFPDSKTLILTHTIGIVKQTIKELEFFGFKAEQVGDGAKPRKFSESIVVGTIQSFCKMPYDSYINEFQVLMVDEAHHISKIDGQYAKVLSNIMSPIRLGFTATLPTDPEPKIALEAFLGPLIENFTIEKAVEAGILAQPRIRLIKTKENPKVKALFKYPDVYQQGIVENVQRNNLICKEASKYIKEGKSCLILVKMIEHGKILREIFTQMGLDIHFVQGLTEANDRENIKSLLESKKTKAVICTTVWREGINIPSLDVIINAAGGKSEIMTLQGIGRGLRRTKDKEEVIIVDIFDNSHHYLISHFGERITLYMEQGWL